MFVPLHIPIHLVVQGRHQGAKVSIGVHTFMLLNPRLYLVIVVMCGREGGGGGRYLRAELVDRGLGRVPGGKLVNT